MMLHRHRIHAPRNRCIGKIDSSFRIGTCTPYIFEDTSAVLCNPKAPILRTPKPVGIYIACTALIVYRGKFHPPGHFAVPSHKFYVIHIGVPAGSPLTAHRSGITSGRIQAYAVYQVESGRRFQQRLWSSKTGKCRRIIPEDKLRRDRVHSDKGSTFSHFHGVRGTIEALREKHCLSRLCRLA